MLLDEILRSICVDFSCGWWCHQLLQNDTELLGVVLPIMWSIPTHVEVELGCNNSKQLNWHQLWLGKKRLNQNFADDPNHGIYALLQQYTIQKLLDKLPYRPGLPRYFRIEPDLNPVDGYPDRTG